MKGGVGKTTVVALLGRYAAEMNLRVLVVDLDPQANLSQAYMGNAYKSFLAEQEPSIVEIFNGYRPPTRERGSTTRLDFEDTVHDVFADGRLEFIPSRFDFSDNLVHALNPNPRILAHFIADHFQDRDVIFIDCPPTESVFTQAAYHASRYVLIPVRPEFLATIGFPLLAESLRSFRTENPSHHIEVTGIVINNGFYHGGNDGGPEKTNAMKEIFAEAKKNRWHVFPYQIPHSRGFPKLMRGDRRHLGNSYRFEYFAEDFFGRLHLEEEE